MRGASDSTMLDIKIAASDDHAVEVTFEPVGTKMALAASQEIYLRVPASGLDSLEIVVWSGGIDVWTFPYPGEHDYLVLNDRKEVLEIL
jgi:hypothetical protein